MAPNPGKYDTATLRKKLPQGKSAFFLPFLILCTYPLFLSFFVWKASPPSPIAQNTPPPSGSNYPRENLPLAHDTATLRIKLPPGNSASPFFSFVWKASLPSPQALTNDWYDFICHFEVRFSHDACSFLRLAFCARRISLFYPPPSATCIIEREVLDCSSNVKTG